MGKTIKGYYEQDHDRLDGLFKTYCEMKRKDFAKAKEAFVAFKFGLQRHIVWEEEILFPLFEEKTGISEGGPTAVMCAEHRMIKKELEAIHDKVAEKNPDTDEEEEKLLSVLSVHNQKEENVLYPAIDRFVSEIELAKVFREMENIPPERYEKCCGG